MGEIRDVTVRTNKHLLWARGQKVYFQVQDGPTVVNADMSRADFIAAVESELDGIFISRADLPRVRVGIVGEAISSNGWTRSGAAEARRDALHLLAIAEYLDTHPPIDEAQVEALAADYHPSTDHARDGILLGQWLCNCRVIAHRVLATGRVSVTL